MAQRSKMKEIRIGDLSLPIRESLSNAIDEAWKRLADPGTWWSGNERIAIAAEVRKAETCLLCQQRKASVTPYAIVGEHQSNNELPDSVVEAIHRLKTDAGRITQTWVRNILRDDLTEEQYVEIIAITAIVTAVDTFDDALGRPRRTLPSGVPGPPTQKRPGQAKRDIAWVATLAPEDIPKEELNPFAVHGDKNIHRGLSLVPQEVMNFFDLDVELYLRDEEIRDFEVEYRAISHAQIELIAARASAINACFY